MAKIDMAWKKLRFATSETMLGDMMFIPNSSANLATSSIEILQHITGPAYFWQSMKNTVTSMARADCTLSEREGQHLLRTRLTPSAQELLESRHLHVKV